MLLRCAIWELCISRAGKNSWNLCGSTTHRPANGRSSYRSRQEDAQATRAFSREHGFHKRLPLPLVTSNQSPISHSTFAPQLPLATINYYLCSKPSMLSTGLLFGILFCRIGTAVLSGVPSKHQIFGKNITWNINEWTEDKDPQSTGSLTYISALATPYDGHDGVIFSGQLAPDAGAYYGQRYRKEGILSDAPNATGFSLTLDPLNLNSARKPTSLRKFIFEIGTQGSKRYEHAFLAPIDDIEFKTIPMRVDLPFSAFYLTEDHSPEQNHPIIPKEITELGFYIRGPVNHDEKVNPNDKYSFSLTIKQITAYSD